jgi:hypothetical protein
VDTLREHWQTLHKRHVLTLSNLEEIYKAVANFVDMSIREGKLRNKNISNILNASFFLEIHETGLHNYGYSAHLDFIMQLVESLYPPFHSMQINQENIGDNAFLGLCWGVAHYLEKLINHYDAKFLLFVPFFNLLNVLRSQRTTLS